MIDLNKYYISSTFQGASGGSEGRAGYVPQALSGDELKFLRGDGTWQELQTTAQSLSYTESSAQLSITNGNTVSLSSLSDKSYANSNFLRLSGGNISGALTVNSLSSLGRILSGGKDLLDIFLSVSTTIKSEVRSNFVSPYTYTGLAAAGTAEGIASWKIRRSQFNDEGSYVTTLTAINVKWEDRLTVSYT